MKWTVDGGLQGAARGKRDLIALGILRKLSRLQANLPILYDGWYEDVLT